MSYNGRSSLGEAVYMGSEKWESARRDGGRLNAERLCGPKPW
jgi:hypothetical protein